jgi:predicted O-methyltransferase YrrM
MTSDRTALLDELEAFGIANDSRVDAHAAKMLNITRDTGQFLAMLVRLQRPTRILEVGTSNGYSTIWLADAARACGAMIETIERDPSKLELARDNFCRAGVGDVITQIEGEAAAVLSTTADETYEFIFLDSKRTEYAAWWPNIRRILRPGGLVVCDNATSHPQEFVEFSEVVAHTPAVAMVVVPIGKGELLIQDERAIEQVNL